MALNIEKGGHARDGERLTGEHNTSAVEVLVYLHSPRTPGLLSLRTVVRRRRQRVRERAESLRDGDVVGHRVIAQIVCGDAQSSGTLGTESQREGHETEERRKGQHSEESDMTGRPSNCWAFNSGFIQLRVPIMPYVVCLIPFPWASV